jgi:hypothetical protein
MEESAPNCIQLRQFDTPMILGGTAKLIYEAARFAITLKSRRPTQC